MLSSVKLAGLELLGGSSYALHDPAEGLEAPLLRISEYDKPGEDGGVVSSSYYGQRAITFQGLVQGGSDAAHEANRQALLAACALQRDSSAFPVLKLLEITTKAGQTFFTYVQVKRLQLDVGRGTTSRFMVSLVAPDPRLYTAGENTTGSITRPSGGGFILPVNVPIVSDPQSGGSATINNAGTIPTYPKLILKGLLTNPYILNSTLGEAFQLNRTIAVGETVTIDMAEKTVLLNGTSSLLSAKTTDSRWWSLEPGTNLIAFSSGSASDDGTLEITWHDAYLGL
jgi:hypothetical protein